MNQGELQPAFSIPGSFHRTETIVKRSRFITTFLHVDSPGAARSAIARVKDEFPHANHNCWAFAAGPPGDTAKVGMSDDGEPHNTAGRPMLNVLIHSGVGEIAVVTTRFFGGIKLGTGGLVRAYSNAVKTGMETLPLKEKRITENLTFQFSYRSVSAVKNLADAMDAGIIDETYGEEVTLCVELPQVNLEKFRTKVLDLTLGTARFIKK